MTETERTADSEKRAWAFHDRGDAPQALVEFLQLAAAGKPYYLVVAARMYMDGRGVEVDLIRAAELLDQASTLGVPEASLQRAALARMKGDDKSYFKLLGEADRSYILSARYLLALCYFRGKGTEPDASKAMMLMRDAADRGHVGARAFLAIQLLKRPIDVVGFIRGAVLWVLTAMHMVVLFFTNRDDERLR